MNEHPPRVTPHEEEPTVPVPVVEGAYQEAARVGAREEREEKIDALTNEYLIAEQRLVLLRANIARESGVSDERLNEFELLMDAKNELAAKLREVGVDPKGLTEPAVH